MYNSGELVEGLVRSCPRPRWVPIARQGSHVCTLVLGRSPASDGICCVDTVDPRLIGAFPGLPINHRLDALDERRNVSHLGLASVIRLSRSLLPLRVAWQLIFSPMLISPISVQGVGGQHAPPPSPLSRRRRRTRTRAHRRAITFISTHPLTHTRTAHRRHICSHRTSAAAPNNCSLDARQDAADALHAAAVGGLVERAASDG